MARELRKAARDSGEDAAAHHGRVKMIPQWQRSAPATLARERGASYCHLVMLRGKPRLPAGTLNPGGSEG